jgi:hypothetical protein
MRRMLLSATTATGLVFAGTAGTANAEPVTAGDVGAQLAGCIEAAAFAYRLPAAVLLILLHVEGGSLGQVSQNDNGTVDIGPMQVNQIWLPMMAAHWRASVSQAYHALRDDFCANVEAGAWILRQGIDEARGDFWEGVGYYHSHDPGYKTDYLRKVLHQTLRLAAEAARTLTPLSRFASRN